MEGKRMTHRFLDEVELVGLSMDWSNLTDEQQMLINTLVETGSSICLMDGMVRAGTTRPRRGS